MKLKYTISKLEEMKNNLEESSSKYSEIGKIMIALKLREKAEELKEAISLLKDLEEGQ